MGLLRAQRHGAHIYVITPTLGAQPPSVREVILSQQRFIINEYKKISIDAKRDSAQALGEGELEASLDDIREQFHYR